MGCEAPTDGRSSQSDRNIDRMMRQRTVPSNRDYEMIYFSRSGYKQSEWAFGEWLRVFRDLRRIASSVRPGDVVALVRGFYALPYFGVVVGNDGAWIDVSSSGGDFRIPAAAPDDDWIPDDESVVCVPASRDGMRTAARFLANTGLDRWELPDPHRLGSYLKSYEFCTFSEEAFQLALSLGYGIPGAVRLGSEEDRRVCAVMETLPGYTGDVRPGYIGWMPYCDYARSVECDGWQEFVDFIGREGFQVYDFYFGATNDSARCPVCLGCGISAEYQELKKGFLPSGGGRWAGWSKDLYQDEIDALVELGRIKAPDGVSVVPENYRSYLDSWSLDEIAAYRLSMLRAPRLGIPMQKCTSCEPCEDDPDDKTYSSGYVALSGKRLELNAWVGSPLGETAYVVQVNDVGEDDIPEIARFMAQAGRHLLAGLDAFARAENVVVHEVAARGCRGGDGWNSDVEIEDWPTFAEQFHVDSLNLPVGYAMASAAGNPREIAEGTRMAVFMLHPRKGAHRTVFVEKVSEADRTSIIEVLASGARIHATHFEWARRIEGASA